MPVSSKTLAQRGPRTRAEPWGAEMPTGGPAHDILAIFRKIKKSDDRAQALDRSEPDPSSPLHNDPHIRDRA